MVRSDLPAVGDIYRDKQTGIEFLVTQSIDLHGFDEGRLVVFGCTLSKKKVSFSYVVRPATGYDYVRTVSQAEKVWHNAKTT